MTIKRGLSPNCSEMMQAIMHAYGKGPESSGEGLVVAICKQLSGQYGMHLVIS